MKPFCRPLSRGFTAAIGIRSSATPWHASAPAPETPLRTNWQWSGSLATMPEFRRAPALSRTAAKSRYDGKFELAAELAARAFSSEVDTGSREENASKQKIKTRFVIQSNQIGI